MSAPYRDDDRAVEMFAITFAGAFAWFCVCVADLAAQVIR